MTPEKMLIALNDIDSRSIQEARADKSPAGRFRGRRIAVILAAVIALVGMTITAFAAEDIAGWFRTYFAQWTDDGLSAEQIVYISENEQIVEQTQEVNGYSINLVSYLANRDTIYLTLGVTAPQNVALSGQDHVICLDNWEIRDDMGTPPFSWGFHVQDDFDGLDNTANIVVTIQPWSEQTASSWNIHIDALHTTFYNESYEQELLRTKYAGQTDVMFTSEETEKIYEISTLAEGPWDFTVSMDNTESEQMELLSSPVTVQAIVTRHGSDDITSDDYLIDALEDVSVTSFILRPLDATIRCNCSDSVMIAAEHLGREVYAVMKDGSRIQLTMGSSGIDGVQKLLAESPIVLDEVDYILLADGTVLTAP